MTLLIQDTARNNLTAWVEAAVKDGIAAGAIISPFTSPVTATTSGFKPGAQQCVDRLQQLECQVWFDPMTHVLQMAGAGDWRYYDQWELWPNNRGQISDDGDIEQHIERVFRVQDRLGVPRLAPTILLHSPQSQTSLRALKMAELSASMDKDATQSISGDSTFWASGDDLDAHVGALAQFTPPRWSLSVARLNSTVPVPATSDEVAGLCRTSRSLSEEAEVHISHGDIAALPAVAAGAMSLGTGWDTRQRVLAYSDFQERIDSPGGGQWYKRPTLEVLLGSLSSAEFAQLESRHARTAQRLLTGTLLPGVQESFMHHARSLQAIIEAVSLSDYEASYRALEALYETASYEWPAVNQATGARLGSREWVEPFLGGLLDYGASEGWR